MENEKKPQRLAVRLSALFTVFMLLVALAVPAFAYGTFPDDIVFPKFFDRFVVVPATVGSASGFRALDLSQFDTIVYSNGQGRFYLNGKSVSVLSYVTVPGRTYWSDGGTLNTLTLGSDSLEIVYSSWDFVQTGHSYTFSPPPPPDPMESFNSGLTVVLDWVGSVVSAVVSGPMSGLLILLAVPVAITLLLVAFIVIRRIVWGA